MRSLQLVFVIVMIGFVGWILFSNAPVEPEKPLEVPRASLELREGRLYLGEESTPFTGNMIERYEDGVLRSRSTVVDGVLEGLSEGWYINRQVQVQEHFQANISHGVRKKWYENGTLMSETTIENGKHQGRFRRWHENGQLAEEMNMVQGEPHGVCVSFYPSGFLKVKAQLDHGRLVEQSSWEDGEKQSESKEELL